MRTAPLALPRNLLWAEGGLRETLLRKDQALRRRKRQAPELTAVHWDHQAFRKTGPGTLPEDGLCRRQVPATQPSASAGTQSRDLKQTKGPQQSAQGQGGEDAAPGLRPPRVRVEGPQEA